MAGDEIERNSNNTHYELNSDLKQEYLDSFSDLKEELLKCITNPKRELDKLKEYLAGFSTLETFYLQSTNLGKYYLVQYNLLNALKDMYSQKSEASTDDQVLLNFLHYSILTNWEKAIVDNADKTPTEEYEIMLKFSKEKIEQCEFFQSLVKDETSGALIKNVLLILSAIVTLGLSLAVYAAITTESRAKSGHFFFHNESSKDKIAPVENQLKCLEKGLTPQQQSNTL